jgi:predicted ATPase
MVPNLRKWKLKKTDGRKKSVENALHAISISGFKSIRSLEGFPLGPLNVLIGANGAGKSNFVEIFRMIRSMADGNFRRFVLNGGGADHFLFGGPKQTPVLTARFDFDTAAYALELEPTVDEEFLIRWESWKDSAGVLHDMGGDRFESRLSEGSPLEKGEQMPVLSAISAWTGYHFHDTGARAPMRRSEIVQDHRRFRPDAANIAPFLLGLRQRRPADYRKIVEAIQLVTPFFEDFILEPIDKGERETVHLAWKQRGSDFPMQPYHFSDGTLRFICLTTALLQPDPPPTIVIDEPELGLHPFAIEILAEMIQATSRRTQVIISTQSPTLVDCFAPPDIIVVHRENGASRFQRLDETALSAWLVEYSLGELWRKNVFAGGPVRE